MKLKMTINTKMLVYILITSILIFASSVGYISYKTRQLALNDAEKLAQRVTAENALKIEKELSNDLVTLRTLAKAFQVYENMEPEEWQSLFMKMYYKVYENTPDLYKLWDSWELRFIDTTWTNDYGREAHVLMKENNVISHSTSLRSIDGDAGKYKWVKENLMDLLWEPYWDEVVEQGEAKKFMTSLSSPIYYQGQYGGIVAADIIMDRFQKIIEKIKPYDNTIAFLTSNEGVFVGHPNIKLIGENIAKYESGFEDQFQISKLIKEGKSGVFRAKDKNKKDVLVSISPIQVGELNTPWSLVLTIPIDVILKEANRSQIISLIVAFLGLLILTIIIVSISKSISKSLNKTTDILQKLSKGDIEGVQNLNIHSGDEIEEMANSVNTLKDGLDKTSDFAEQIGQGNLNAEFEPLSEKDVLGNALLEMRKSLIHAEEEEKKRKIEDEKQNWATQGLAKFGDILRTNSNNIKDLSFNIMSNLVDYLKVNQGALFVIDDTDDTELYLDLQTTIAYGRDKFINKRIAVGEELVGRCAFENKTIYMTDIPNDYIQITSGMGTANPQALLLVPLILNDEPYGVIELASFHNIEDYQIKFVEKLGESIASTISSVKVNEKTNELLNQSKHQAEELAAQEEEMRQNLEELQATQEESARREYETTGIIHALGSTAFTVEYDLEGTILSCNDKYAQMLGLKLDQIVGQKHSTGYIFNPEKKANYDLFWGDLRRGISKKESNKVEYNGKELWIEETYSPIISQHDDKPYKILKIGFDITEQKQDESKIVEQENKLKEQQLIINEYLSKIKTLEQALKNSSTTKIQEVKSIKETAKIEEKPVLTITATGDNLLDWTDEYVLGISEMDEQHEQLVNLANSIYISLKNEKTKKEVKDNIKSFVDYASYHFGNEEHYFEQFSFENSESHASKHKEFIKEISQFQKDYSGNKVKLLDEIMTYIKEWLYIQFTQDDIKYVNLFKENGL
ncbi:MAG: bacteriohemerythrin [Salinivirgaceae bacterium]|nr:bacteriohemerythrin [Salinivirgaceae bacterium]